MKDKLLPFLCGFRKMEKCMDDSGTIVAVIMDLSKAYDCIPHDVLITKLHAYGVCIKTLKLLFSYLMNRKQRVKVNESFSECPGGYSTVKNMGGGWLDSLGSEILVEKIFWGSSKILI